MMAKWVSTKKVTLGMLTLMALLPNVSFAAHDVFTIYAYGNGNVLRQIFEGMKGLVSDGGYRYMIMTIMLMGMIFALTKGYLFGRPDARPIMGVILLAIGMNLLLFSDTAKTDLHIEDPVSGEDYLVSDMPLVIAGASALSSEMSRYMVKLVEGYYIGPAIPQLLWMSNNNTYNFAAKILSGMKDITISDPVTKASFNSYMEECVVPSMYQGKIKFQDLLYGPPDGFWDSIKVDNLARMSLCFDSCQGLGPDATCTSANCPAPLGETSSMMLASEWREGQPAPCPDQWAALKTRIEGIIGATAFNNLGHSMLKDTTILDNVVSSTMTQVTGLAGGSGVEYFQRAGMMNMFRESSANVIANGGSAGVIQVMGVEQAKATQKTNWMISGEVFAEAVAYLWAALQAFIFAIFPFAVILMIFPGLGGKAAFGYFGLLAWISLWMPFLAVINYLSISWLTEDIRQLGFTPLSYASLTPISQAGANMQAITTFLGTMVPILTYGMVRGGEFALTQLAQDASAPRASQAASQQVAAKSYNYGSISADNVGMNKFDSTTSYATGTGGVALKQGNGTLMASDERGGNTQSFFGSPMSVTSTASYTADKSKTGSLAMQEKQSISTSLGSSSSISDSAEKVASHMEAGSAGRSTMEQKSQEQKEAWNNLVQSGLQSVKEVGTQADVSLSGQQQGALTARGAAMAGFISGALEVEGLGKFKDGGGPALADRINSQSAGGVSGFFSEAFGRPVSEKEGREFISQVNDAGLALQNKYPEMSKEDRAGMIRASTMMKMSNDDIDSSVKGGVISKDYGDALKEAKVTYGRDEQGRSTDLVDQASRNPLVNGAGVIVLGTGAAAGSFLSQLPGVNKAFNFNGMLTMSGTSSQKESTSTGSGFSLNSNDTSAMSRAAAVSGVSSEGAQRVLTTTDSLANSVKSVISNTRGVTNTSSQDGSVTTTATEATSAKDAVSVQASLPMGTHDQEAQFGYAGMVNQNARNTQQIISERDKVSQDAQTKTKDNVDNLFTKIDAGKYPEAPNIDSVKGPSIKDARGSNPNSQTVSAPDLPDKGPTKFDAPEGMRETQKLVEGGRERNAENYSKIGGETADKVTKTVRNNSRFTENATLTAASENGSTQTVGKGRDLEQSADAAAVGGFDKAVEEKGSLDESKK